MWIVAVRAVRVVESSGVDSLCEWNLYMLLLSKGTLHSDSGAECRPASVSVLCVSAGARGVTWAPIISLSMAMHLALFGELTE